MENASKALEIAGTILISMMIIGALVFMYRSISNSKNINQDTTVVEQIAEFNKGYEAYEKTIYGSELLSLANKMSDYNNSIDKYGYTGYKKMQLELKNNAKYNNLENMIKINSQIDTLKSKYSGSENIESLIEIYDVLNNTPNEIKKIQAEKQRTDILNKCNLSVSDINMTELEKYSEYIEFKRKKVKFVSSDYDENGRIIKMIFEE